MAERFTIQELNKRLKDNGKAMKIIDTEYINSKTAVKCLCLLCGEEFYMNYETMKKANGCQKCGKERSDRKRSLTFETMKAKVEKLHPTIEILSKEYKNSKTKITCKCKIDGHTWETNYGNLKIHQRLQISKQQIN